MPNDTEDFSNLPLPDVTETEINDASTRKKLGETPRGSVYRWIIVSATRDISDPEGSAKGWMMLPIECQAVAPPVGDSDKWMPTNFKTRTWILLPRTPSKQHLLKRGYGDEQADKVLSTFNPNGKDDFVYNKFARFVRTVFPEQFPRIAGWNKDQEAFVTYAEDGSVSVVLGTDDDAKAKVKELTKTQVAAIKAAAATLFADPKPLIGRYFFDGYVYKEDQDGKVKDFGELLGFPSANVPVAKDGTPYRVLDPNANTTRD